MRRKGVGSSSPAMSARDSWLSACPWSPLGAVMGCQAHKFNKMRGENPRWILPQSPPQRLFVSAAGAAFSDEDVVRLISSASLRCSRFFQSPSLPPAQACINSPGTCIPQLQVVCTYLAGNVSSNGFLLLDNQEKSHEVLHLEWVWKWRPVAWKNICFEADR